uniref:PEP-CTERM protein-sorting domain-containing protein n=1 Tax=Solibacter usitatus (strain Ellin6076) TaxID=234267 RepID=Q01UL1_SOLUE
MTGITRNIGPSLILAFLMLASQASAASLIVNGSFDAPGTQVGGFTSACSQSVATINCPFLSPGSGSGGWQVTILGNNGQIDCVVPGNAVGGGTSPTLICTPGNPPSTQVTGGGYKFTLWQAPGPSLDKGNYFLADGGSSFSGALSQSVSGLTVGSLYKLTFWQAAGQENCLYDDGVNCDPPGNVNLTQDWQVTFGSTSLTSTTMSTPIHTSFAWNQQIMFFTATATTQVLTFLAQGTPNSAPPILMLDGVTLESAPEPATSALFALGLGLLAIPLGRRLLPVRSHAAKRSQCTTVHLSARSPQTIRTGIFTAPSEPRP